MRRYCFLDLDDTIFQTLRKCPDPVSAVPAAYDKAGEALSFITPKQQDLLAWLHESSLVIPTTARNLRAFRAVSLRWEGPAILNCGATILQPEGTLCEEWDQQMRPKLKELEPLLEESLAWMKARTEKLGLALRLRIVTDFGMHVYIVAKNVEPASGDLFQLYQHISGEGVPEEFFVHFNDNNLAIIPRVSGKEAAVRFVLERERALHDEECLAIGIGDSLSDIPFFGVTDFALIPRRSQIMTKLLKDGHV